MLVLKFDSQTWKGLENPFVLLRRYDFRTEEEDIALNLDTFSIAKDFVYNPDKQVIIFRDGEEKHSYRVYKISEEEGRIIDSDFLGYICEDVVKGLFSRAYKETRPKTLSSKL
ncbi:hypothetical protein DRN73_03835 [Candidatus Pacearchaeota archaeon]|nr:MAG: hypothetical protein DRN73_03835 [Candidatus Pacearchaeota archaeon]